MTYRQTAWVTLNGITFERSAAIAIRRFDVDKYQRVMARLVQLRFWILQEPRNASSPEMVVVEKVQIDELRVWYARGEVDMTVLRIELTTPCGRPNTVHLLYRAEVPSRPVGPGDVILYGDDILLTRTAMDLPRILTRSRPVAFQLILRDGRLQLALDTRPDGALSWEAGWTVPQWPDEKNALMLKARLLIDLRLQRDAGIRGAFRIWHRGALPRTQAVGPIPAQDILPELLSAPRPQPKGDVAGPEAPRLQDLTYRLDAETRRQIAQKRTMMQAMELLSKGRSDGWALCLDALRSSGKDVGYDLSLEVALRQRTLRRRWQGKVDIKG
ncbi:hypothetical protein [Salipiger thiooxidans]|uniref:hypothetical protein n=1 Tax=Salipiger thiooxidans TaxID=282683 RepID=UPI001F5DDB10|nr:hypothetical protein [Salipiger thiooxidans]